MLAAQILAARRDTVAMEAARLQQFAMHVNHALRAGALMQIVDVLRHQRQLAAMFRQRPLERRQREMRAVRLRAEEIAPPRVVEGLNGGGIAGEGLGRRELHRIEARPDALSLLVAEGSEPAFGRDAGSSQREEPHGFIALAQPKRGGAGPWVLALWRVPRPSHGRDR